MFLRLEACDIGQHGGDVLIRQRAQRRHHASDMGVIHLYAAGHPMEDHLNDIAARCVLGEHRWQAAFEARELAGQACCALLVTQRAVGLVDAFSGLCGGHCDDTAGEDGARDVRRAKRPGHSATPISAAVEQWYSMLDSPKHQMMSLLPCGLYTGVSRSVVRHMHWLQPPTPQQSR